MFLSVAVVLSVFPLYFMTVSATNTSHDVLASKLLPGSHLIDNFKKLVDVPAPGDRVLPLDGQRRRDDPARPGPVLDRRLRVRGLPLAGEGPPHGPPAPGDHDPVRGDDDPAVPVFAKLGLVNSTIAVILPVIATPFLILLFRQASRTFPHEIIEAARIDGAGRGRHLLPHVHPDDEPSLCCRGRHHLPGRVEQLPVAEGDPRQQRVPDHADADLEPALRLRHRLRSAHARRVHRRRCRRSSSSSLLQRSFVEGFTGAIK